VDSLAPDIVLPRLRGRFGRPYRYAVETASTQQLLPLDAPEGAVAIAEHQTAGRGRLGRNWQAPPRSSVLLSILLRPVTPPAALPELSVVGAEAVADAITAVAGLEPAIKHPNDVLVDGRKVAGVLGEAREGAVILGIGINANIAAAELPTETRLPATSLLAEAGRPVDRAALAVELLLRLEQRYLGWLQGHGASALVDWEQS
jgi:BirA family transcriptional regulator, biotin operon repressor / biotin---[acetyl-CoA-carboxylase] ligase